MLDNNKVVLGAIKASIKMLAMAASSSNMASSNINSSSMAVSNKVVRTTITTKWRNWPRSSYRAFSGL